MIPQDIINKIKNSQDIIILPHISTDGDALGSSFALALALKKIGKSVEVYLEEEIPQIYDFLPKHDTVVIYPDEYDKERRITSIETVIALDTGDLDRLGKRIDILNNARFHINIDHHPTNTNFAQLNYVNSKASATCEIVYELINDLGIELDNEIALCLYTGILTDTGGFKYNNTTSLTHLIVSKLISYDIDITDISYKIFDALSVGKLKLIGNAINSIELHEDGKIAIITVTKKMIADSAAIEEDTEGVINYARNIKGVEIAALFKEKAESETKVSLRSKSYANVAEVASKHNGGGHKNAAGCTINANPEDAKKLIFDDLINALGNERY